MNYSNGWYHVHRLFLYHLSLRWMTIEKKILRSVKEEVDEMGWKKAVESMSLDLIKEMPIGKVKWTEFLTNGENKI